MVRVRLTVEYDMDIDHEPTDGELANELQDWLSGNVDVQDLIGADPDFKDTSVRIGVVR
jgi:hypothetical protein